MVRSKVWGISILSLAFLLSGCVVRTYSVYKDRVDQNLDTGNRGFVAGTPAPARQPEKTKRETKVVEVEWLPLKQSVGAKKVKAAKTEPGETALAPAEKSGEPLSGGAQEYKVQENDTLEKISKKFYGSVKKWHRIYEANRDVLKSPDKLRPGQLLKIPADVAPAVQTAAPQAPKLQPPAEHLK